MEKKSVGRDPTYVRRTDHHHGRLDVNRSHPSIGPTSGSPTGSGLSPSFTSGNNANRPPRVPEPVEAAPLVEPVREALRRTLRGIPAIVYDSSVCRFLAREALVLDAHQVASLGQVIGLLVNQQQFAAAGRFLLMCEAGTRVSLLQALGRETLVALRDQPPGPALEDFDIAVSRAATHALGLRPVSPVVEWLLSYCRPRRGMPLALKAGFADTYWACSEAYSKEGSAAGRKKGFQQQAPLPRAWPDKARALASPQAVRSAINKAFAVSQASGLAECKRWWEVALCLSGAGALRMLGAMADALDGVEPSGQWSAEEKAEYATLLSACWIAEMPPVLFGCVPAADQSALLATAARQVANAEGDRQLKGLQALLELHEALRVAKSSTPLADELRDYLLQALAELEGPNSPVRDRDRPGLVDMRQRLASHPSAGFVQALARGDWLGAAACAKCLDEVGQGVDALSELSTALLKPLGGVGIQLDWLTVRTAPLEGLSDAERLALKQRQRVVLEHVLCALLLCGNAKDHPRCQALQAYLDSEAMPLSACDAPTRVAIARVRKLAGMPALLMLAACGSPLLSGLWPGYLDPVTPNAGEPWPAQVRAALSTDEGALWLRNRLAEKRSIPDALGDLAVLVLSHPEADAETVVWLFKALCERVDLRAALESSAPARAGQGATPLLQDFAVMVAHLVDAMDPLPEPSDAEHWPRGWKELLAFGRHVQRVVPRKDRAKGLAPDAVLGQLAVFLKETKADERPPEMLDRPLGFFQAMWFHTVLSSGGAWVPGEVSRYFLGYRYEQETEQEAGSAPEPPGAEETGKVFRRWRDTDLARWWVRAQGSEKLMQRAQPLNPTALRQLMPEGVQSVLMRQLAIAMLNSPLLAVTVANGVKTFEGSNALDGGTDAKTAVPSFGWDAAWVDAFVRAIQTLLCERGRSPQAFAGGIRGPHAEALANILLAAQRQCPDEMATWIKTPGFAWLNELLTLASEPSLGPIEVGSKQENAERLQRKRAALAKVLNAAMPLGAEPPPATT